MTQVDVTLLLRRMAKGDTSAEGELLPWLYEELCSIARRSMQGERREHTLQPTALVHEAWIRLLGGEEVPAAKDREHFVRLAARAMRNVLIDHARARVADKRAGDRVQETAGALDQLLTYFESEALDVIDLDAALIKFAQVDPELARLVEMRYFAGLGIDEVAQLLSRSPSWVDRGWRTARLWLLDEIEQQRSR